MRITPRKVTMLAWAYALMGTSAQAQGTGTLRFLVDPGNNYSFVLDGKYRMQEREMKLLEGPHTFTFWAPTRMMVDTVLRVLPDRTTDVLLRLPYSPEFVAYQRELAQVKKEQWVGRVLPSVVTLGTGIWAAISFANYKDAHDQLQADEDLYNSSASPNQIERLKSTDLPTHQEDFKQARTTFAISGGLFVASAAFTTWSIIKASRKPMPTFEDKEKVKFDGLVWVPDRRGGTWAMGLTIPIR
ncbi:MAG: hypothetical protein IPN38_09035 [Flavobacteriales bacterium]|nr:hypothetical protein [Flavobacteriales bacterium]